MVFPSPSSPWRRAGQQDDQDKLSKALAALSEEDPTFRVKSDKETNQTVISGMGELHLEILRRPDAPGVQGRGQRRPPESPTARRSPPPCTRSTTAT